jgi:hypothetical protein
MNFPQVTVESLLGELVELQADWMDETATQVVAQIATVLPTLRAMTAPPAAADLVAAFQQSDAFLDICRLFMGVSQETAAHQISAHFPPPSRSWTTLRRVAHDDPAALAGALVALGLPAIIFADVKKQWTVEDILVDRYKMSRGRATAGQARGRSLEVKVEEVLRPIVPFESRVTFTGRRGQTAKCDIAIPTRDHPKIVIEAKGFEATGSKLTDFLGDIGKIILAKESQMYFFVVTDGRGWAHRTSDLQHVVDHQHVKDVDMVYTSSRLAQLAQDVKHIWEHERGT